jgi:hypothetical protein
VAFKITIERVINQMMILKTTLFFDGYLMTLNVLFELLKTSTASSVTQNKVTGQHKT